MGHVDETSRDEVFASHGALKPFEHFVQLYGADRTALSINAIRYFLNGLENGDALAIIATPENRRAFCEELKKLGVDLDALIRGGQAMILDAEEGLCMFMDSGRPDPATFRKMIGTKLDALRAKAVSGEVRAYGEMVGVLWADRYFTAAMQLEDLWNDLLASTRSKLFCAYPIDVFGTGFHACDIDGLLASHTHMIPADADRTLEKSIYQAMDETLGPDNAMAMRSRMDCEIQVSWSATLRAEAVILWLRKNLTECADTILGNARQLFTS